MEPNLQAIIRRTLAEAQAARKDYLTQTEEAVRAVVQTFPEMTASEAPSLRTQLKKLPFRQDSSLPQTVWPALIR
jgi:Tfp pilus assembly protein PilP